MRLSKVFQSHLYTKDSISLQVKSLEYRHSIREIAFFRNHLDPFLSNFQNCMFLWFNRLDVKLIFKLSKKWIWKVQVLFPDSKKFLSIFCCKTRHLPPSQNCLRVEFLFKTDSGYPRDAGVFFHSRWQTWTLGVPSALTPIGQLHQSPPLPVPGDLGRCPSHQSHVART